MVATIVDYIGGKWTDTAAADHSKIINPASTAVIAEVLMTPKEIVAQAVETGQQAYQAWRRVPVGERIQPMFRLKSLLEQHIDELARIITNECGKTYGEAAAEIRRGIENVEVACG
ncbi:MAG TPA: aldehyde dehydrogenase family protein, partial [Phototrophicaceae bacterium]|nr:aldehyde dehydrogenase family protein [Phototrophicaceae bacterium]